MRIKRICIVEKEFEQLIHEMGQWFQRITFPNKVLDEKLVKVRFSNQEKTCSKKGKDIPLVITYHPAFQALHDIIKRNLNWLYAKMKSKNYFHLDPWSHFEVLRN